ncbi:GGDEF domain-containing protein [Actinoplanes sp. NPDC051851]|uniref:GGDEF domain-containing protein n=1 Tax=Actinoplanes sp. NPDC051851 TaxID=3154753 RepID=UPI00341A66FC
MGSLVGVGVEQDTVQRWVRPAVLYMFTGLLLAAAIVGALSDSGSAASWYGNLAQLMMDGVGTACAVAVGARRGLSRRVRRAWGFIAAALGLLTLGAANHVLIAGQVVAPDMQMPFFGETVRLAFVAMMLTGLLLLPRPSGGLSKHKTTLDVCIVVIAGGMLMWHYVTGPAITANLANGKVTFYFGSGQPSGVVPVAPAIIFPICYAVLLFGVALVMLNGVDPSVRRPVRLLANALLLQLSGNVGVGYLISRPGSDHDTSTAVAVIMVAHFLFTAAAFEQTRAVPVDVRPGRPKGAVSVMPYAGVVVGLLLLLDSTLRDGALHERLGVVLGAMALTVLVLLRQVTVLRENHQLAVTDALTGLANRAHLNEALSRALARSARNNKSVGLLLADLNGFKQVNDALGHAAGDRMLVEFAGMLRRSVLGRDFAARLGSDELVIARLGGDEFVVVLHDIDDLDGAEVVVRRLHAEMERPIMIRDTPVQVRCAVGVALAGPGDDDADALLQRADEAMYQNKHQLKAAVSRQAREADLQGCPPYEFDRLLALPSDQGDLVWPTAVVVGRSTTGGGRDE